MTEKHVEEKSGEGDGKVEDDQDRNEERSRSCGVVLTPVSRGTRNKGENIRYQLHILHYFDIKLYVGLPDTPLSAFLSRCE